MGQSCSSVCDCCNKDKVKFKRDIKISCFGIDGSGKTTILKIIKGEDPRGVLSTNGFSMMEMDYDAQFHIRFYDIGGSASIRDIWSNYYGEVHGIMFIIGVDDREDESIGALQDMMRHPQSSRKPILIVLNNKNNSELDDVEFSNRANLQEIADSQQQMVFITHINTYDGSLNNVKAPVPFLIRYRKNRTALLEQFSCFIDKIIEHYVYLSEGVRAAELALKLKQNEDREARKLKMMQDQHDQRAADVALLEGRATAQLSSGRLSIANHVNEVKHDSNLITTEPTPEDPIPEIPTIGSFHPPEQILEQPEPEEVIYAEPHKVLDYSSIHNDEMIINPSYIEHSDSNKLSAVSKDYPESGRSQRRVSISGKSRTNKITPVNEGIYQLISEVTLNLGTIYKEGDPGPNLDIFTVSHEAGKIEYDPELAKSKKLRYIRRMDRIAKNTTLKLSNEVTPTPDNVSIKSLGLSHI